MPSPIGYDTLKTLYDLALETGELEPWEFMTEEEAWVLRLPTETFYTLVIGAEGVSRALVFYREKRGYAAWRDILFHQLDEEEAIQRLDSLTVYFEPWNQLEFDDNKRLQRLGFQSGTGLWPNITRFRPSRVPSFLDGDEIALLIPALRASLSILKRRIKNGIPLLPPEDQLLPNFKVDSKGHPGPVAWLAPPEVHIEEPPPAAPPDELGLRRISKAPLAPDVPWEILMGNSGVGIRDAEGSGGYIPLLAIFACVDSGYVTGFAMAGPEEMPSFLPIKLMEAMEKHGACPSSLRVRQKELVKWLKPVAGGLGIDIERVETVPMAEEALTALREAARRGELKRKR
jgi:hypothetical protein